MRNQITIYCLVFCLAACSWEVTAREEQPAGIVHANATGPYFEEGQSPKPANKQWVPVEKLSDDFDGDTLDKEKWQTDPLANGWGWIGRPPGLFREDNVVVADGMMNVAVSMYPEPVTVRGQKFLYEGAIVRSLHPGKVGWYFEARMKANKTAMSSTFWLMTPNSSKRKLELDIQECVGQTSELTQPWGRKWDEIFHSNLIKRETREHPKVQLQRGLNTPTKNHENFYVYAAWWKSPEEVQFFLDGKYAYSLKPGEAWDVPSYLQMAIETYDWNPVPEGGGLIATGTEDERTTKYDWIRVWQLK